MPRTGDQQVGRPARGLLRIPYVRRCTLAFADGRTAEGYLVNINVLGAYIAVDEMPTLGESVTCRFREPDREREIVLTGSITWVNARQQHPVHSLPPGFGLKLQPLPEADQRAIEEAVEAYIARNPHAAR